MSDLEGDVLSIIDGTAYIMIRSYEDELKDIVDNNFIKDPNYNVDKFIDDFKKFCKNVDLPYHFNLMSATYDFIESCDTKYKLELIYDTNHISNWNALARQYLNVKSIDNIDQLLYCIYTDEYYQMDGIDVLASYVYEYINHLD